MLKAIAQISAALTLGTLLASPTRALESKLETAEGLSRIQLVTAVNAVVPGEDFYVGLVLDHEPGFHTYWRGPGIVGVATLLEWDLPDGFEAGNILWPPPKVTDMAGIAANGYETETCLLTKIVVPDTIAGETIDLKVKCAWMACATSCHPGMQDFSLSIPVNRSGEPVGPDVRVKKMFKKVLASIPPQAPEDWTVGVSLKGTNITLRVTFDGPQVDTRNGEFHFFCDDLQVDSDEPQQTTLTGNLNSFDLKQTMVRPDFAPKNPDTISGLLYSSKGWPGIDSKWVEISVPWPEGTFSNE